MSEQKVLIEVDLSGWHHEKIIAVYVQREDGQQHLPDFRIVQPAPVQGDGRADFERYALQLGYNDFEQNEFGGYKNLGSQEIWNFWAASRQALSAQREQPKCRTCNDVGMVGGLLPGDGGYQSDPCPACTFVSVPIGLVGRAAGILGSQGFTVWDEISAELRALLGQREG